MRIGVNKIREYRKDLSPYFYHYVRDFNSLNRILHEKQLKSNKGYICFTEAPVVCSCEMFDYFAHFKKPMYVKYGIGIKRDILIDQFDISPLLYVKDINELQLIDPTLHWKTDILNRQHDFQWLREWRIKGNLDLSSINDEILVIVPDESCLPQCIIGNDLEDIESQEFNSTFPNYTGFLYNKNPNYRILKFCDISSIPNDFQIEEHIESNIKEQFNL